MIDPILVVTDIGKRFASFRALENVTFSLARGEIRALLGINGAGKSTFIKILSGIYRRDAGDISIDGRPVELGSPRSALQAGIVSVQQHPELVADLNGYENIYLGHEATGLLNRRAELRARAVALASTYGLHLDLDRPLNELTAIERELVAILRAVASGNIKVLIMDEPTSVLTEREKPILYGLIRRFQAQGVAVIYITHRLDEVFEIADSFTVFRGGKAIATRSVDAAATPSLMAEMMLGSAVANVYPASTSGTAGIVLVAQGLSHASAFGDVSFDVHKGEILGFFGLLGSGLDELSKCLFGAEPLTAGRVLLEGRPAVFRSPTEAIRAGLFLVPGDRRTEGLVLERDVGFNTTLARLDKVSRMGLMNFRYARRATTDLAGAVDLQPPETYRDAGLFSGGNQQKIVVAKGLFAGGKVYIFVEPTVGVDIGARAKIYSLMRELSRDAAVIVMSSDADEIQGLSDRVIAMFGGRLVVNGPRDSISRQALLVAGLAGQSSTQTTP